MKEFGASRAASEAKATRAPHAAQASEGAPAVRPAIAFAATLVIGFVLGLVTGRVTAPGSGDRAPAIGNDDIAQDERADPKPDESGPGLATIAGLAQQAEEYIENSDPSSGLAAVGEILSHAKVTDFLDWSSDPEKVTGRIINEMSDEELTSTITSLVNVSSEDLGEYSDLRDYANRLTDIALSGLITEDSSEDFADIDLTVQFGTDASSSRGAEDPSNAFPHKTRKIYAVIENPSGMTGSVMVHWYRTDQRQKLLLNQYKISPKDNYSYVWLKRPNRRWEEGEYRVEFYSADEFLAPIASGTYRVFAE